MKGKMRSLNIQGNSLRRSASGTPISLRDTALMTTGSIPRRQLPHPNQNIFKELQ